MIQVYVSIGNSDDKLTQAIWGAYIEDFRELLRKHATQIHGEWYSAPDAVYQNACIAAVLADDDAEEIQKKLTALRRSYGQDTIAWSPAPVTTFI